MRVNPFYVSNLAVSLNQTQASEQQLTAELSSGVRVNSLSDDPLAAGENVLLLNQMQRDDSFTQTSSLVQGQLQVADSALGGVVSQLTQAVSLATSANNGTLNASDLKSISNQIAGFATKWFRWPTPATRGNISLAEARRRRLLSASPTRPRPRRPPTTAMQV